MAPQQTQSNGTARLPSTALLLIFAASLAVSEAIWHWLPAWVPIYRAVVVALAATLVVWLWSDEIRRWWALRRNP